MSKENITILCVIPDQLDGTSFYRGMGPLGHLKRRFNLKMNFVVESTINWSVMSPCDLVFMQRPFISQHVEVMNMAKMMSKPIWIDYDDDLFDVGTDNPTYRVYGKPAIQANVAKCIELADVITVSTKYLFDKISLKNKNCHLIPNSVDMSLFSWRKPNEQNKSKNNLIMWRGSPTHTKDVLSVGNQILDFHDKNKDTLFEFVGDRMFLLTDQMDQARFIHTEWKDVINYHHHIYSRAPKAFMVPLVRSGFNAAKSNCSWLEATFAGALTVAPDLHEFKQPGIFRYETQDEFLKKLNEVMSLNEDDHLYMLNLSWKAICENFNLDVTNKKREEIIKGLV